MHQVFRVQDATVRVYREPLVESVMENVNRVASSEQGCVEDRFEEIIGDSPALESVLAEVDRVAPTGSTLLVLGETGAGKELVARAIHNISPLCWGPFIKLNFAAIHFDLLEIERYV